MERLFSTSKYGSGCQCLKKLWIDVNGDKDLKVPFETNNLIEEGRRLKVAAREYFGKNYIVIPDMYDRMEIDKFYSRFPEAFSKGVNVGLELAVMRTKDALDCKDNKVICNGVFYHEGCYCVCDMLKRNRNGFNLYYVKAATAVEERFMDDLAFQFYILTSLGYNIKKVFLMTINSEYVRGKTLKLKELLFVSEFTGVIDAKSKEVADKILECKVTLLKKEEMDMDVGMHCFKPYPCPYFAHCKQCNGIPERSVFEIPRIRKTNAVEFYEQGIVTLNQALELELDKPIEKQNVSKIVFLRQETGDKVKDYICRSDISSFLATLYYPLYFLDFETFTEAIPSYEGQRPYEQVPFQYSLHYIPKRGGSVHHIEFLAKEGTDPRAEIAKSLCENIPKNACVLAYNMSFEKGCIMRLSDYLPEYSEKLNIIHAHIDDLMIPFQKRWYYRYDMHGSYSIKKVLPSLFPDDPALNYANLKTVHKGDEAMMEFKMLPTYDEEKRKEVREALLRYCELDTFAMVRIFFELEKVSSEEIEPSEGKKKKVMEKNKKRKQKVITNADVIQDNKSE